MASSSPTLSANLQIPQIKYDVFLSFRGEDTRHNFTSHLHAALCRKNIEAFIDNQLRRGDEVSQSLLNAIEASMIFVVIFSKDYASSSWCLDELVKILECKNKYGRIVIPIFHHIYPSNVMNQNGIFGDAFMKLIDRQELFKEKLQRWRCALMDAGKISGYHLNGVRSESELIENIVDDVLKILSDTFSNPSDNKDQLIGFCSRIKEIESLLSTQSKDICTLGIWGIGGVGKTTIAGAIFNKISSYFEGYCFISNVRGEEQKDGGLHHLQQKLLSTLLTGQIVKNGISTVGDNFESKRLRRKKVLIVLDDVTHFEQIELLIGGLQFAVGSRIIITTRDKHVLNICRVDFLYEMEKLAHDDALELFSQHAFGQNNPNVACEELSDKVIKYADGVPLALKVLGRFLVRRNREEWESAINKLKKIPNVEILNVLKISYDGLDHEEKNIFLDIACFFEDKNKNLMIEFLDACGFSGHRGVRVLVDKSLINISCGNIIRMHDLLREMGREIVRKEAVNDPGKRSRLWHHGEIYRVLTCNKVTEAIEGISLDMSQIKELSLDFCVFTKMQKLRFLRFYGENKFRISVYISIFSKLFNMSYFQGSTFTELRYFEWHGYPLNRLPSTIHLENLVSLEIPHSNIEILWNGVQHLGNLKRLDLAGCKQLGKISDLSLAQKLEHLDLSFCTSLIEIHSSIQLLNELRYLSVSGCTNLRRFPEMTSYNNLETLYIDGTAIEEVPSSIVCLSRLLHLNLSNCERLKSLPSNLYQLKSLEFLYLYGCSNLQRLSNEGESLEATRIVDGSETTIREAPSSIVPFSGISGHHPLGFLSYDGLHSLLFLYLNKWHIKELPENIFGCHLASLRNLNLDGNDFERIPESIIHLTKLQKLSLCYCERLKYLPELPHGLHVLDAYNCTSLESMSGLSVLFKEKYSWLTSEGFNLENCLKLDRDELSKITKDILQKLQLMFTTWYNDEGDQTYQRHNQGYICFPGIEIPKWVSNQSTGSSISIKLPPGCFNNNFFGFAFCIIYSFQHNQKSCLYLRVHCECKIKTKDGYWHEIPYVTSLYVRSTSRCLGSDHVLLAHDFKEYSDGFGEYYENNEAFFQFFVEDENGGRVKCYKVIKKCGIHLFYGQGFGESAQHYREFHDLQGEEPHPK